MSEIIINVDPEEVPVVNITVDENSAQEANAAADAARAILDELKNIDVATKLDKGTYTGTASDLEQLILKKHPYNQFKFVQKGFGNTDLQNNEIGDIFCGWSDDGILRYPEAEWLGGPLNTSVNFKPFVTIIIEP